MTPKQIRAGQIAQIVQCIADHYSIPATKIVDRKDYKLRKVSSARHLLAYHLYECGMSFDAIAKLQARDIHTVQFHYGEGKKLVLNGLRDFVDELPRVTTTLELITK